MAKENGVVSISSEEKDFKNYPNLKELVFYKSNGAAISTHNDFRDRIGHIIVNHKDYNETIKFADSYILNFNSKII